MEETRNKVTETKDDKKELRNFLSSLCMQLGLNKAHDYDGVNNNEDIVIYKRAIMKKVDNVQKELATLKMFEKIKEKN